MKPTNPKDAIGSDKLPLHLWPETATAMGCLGMLDGALKYGRANYRAIGVKASIYKDAAKRHIDAWFEGEDIDPDSGVPHLAHALSCLAILVDAEAAGKLTDDRQYRGGYRKLVDNLTPHVARLKAKHADKSPKHYTIAHRPYEMTFEMKLDSGMKWEIGRVLEAFDKTPPYMVKIGKPTSDEKPWHKHPIDGPPSEFEKTVAAIRKRHEDEQHDGVVGRTRGIYETPPMDVYQEYVSGRAPHHHNGVFVGWA